MRIALILLVLLLAWPAMAQRGFFVENRGTPVTKHNVLNCEAPLQCASTGGENALQIESDSIGTNQIGPSGVGQSELADDAVGLDELAACTTGITEYTAGVPACIATPTGGGGGDDITAQAAFADPVNPIFNDTTSVAVDTTDAAPDTVTWTVLPGGVAAGGDVSGNVDNLTVDDVQSATANTEVADDSSLQVATTAFVQQEHDDSAGPCTNQFVRAVNANAAPTCATVAAADVAADVATQAEIDLKAPLADPIFTGSINIPVNGTLDSNGEISIDSAHDALEIRSDAVTYVLHPEQTKCVTIETATTADTNVPVYAMPDAATVTANGCFVDGTSATAQLSDGGGTTVDGAQTCATGTAITWDTAMAGTATFTAGEMVELDVTAATGVNWLTFCWKYTVDPT